MARNDAPESPCSRHTLWQSGSPRTLDDKLIGRSYKKRDEGEIISLETEGIQKLVTFM